MPGRRNAPPSPPGIPPPASTSMLAPHIPPPSLYTGGAVMASRPLYSYGTNIPYSSISSPPFPSFATLHPLPTPYNNINNPFSRPVPVRAPIKYYGWRGDRVLLPGTVGVSEVKGGETRGYRNSNYVDDEVKRHSLKAPWRQVPPGAVGVSEVKGETIVYQKPNYLEDEVKRLSLKGQGLEEKVEGLKKGKRQSDGEVELLKSAVQDVTGMHGQAKEEAESRVQASESEKTKLSEDNAGLRLEIEALIKAKVEDSGKEMERMKSLESEKWQQVSLVFDGEKSKLVKEMRAEISGLERRNSGLKKLNAGLNSRVEALIIEGERLRAQMRSSEAEKAKLAADTAAKIVGLELLNSNLKKENATLLMKTGVLNAHYTGLLARQEELQSKAGKTRALEMLVDSATSMLKSTSRKFQGLPKVEDDETANDDNIEDEELAMKNFDFNSEFGSELLAIEDLFKARTDKIEALEKELLLVREDWYVVED